MRHGHMARKNHTDCVVRIAGLLQERNASVIRAEGESESARLISDATRQYGAGLIELRRIEVRQLWEWWVGYAPAGLR